MSNPAVEAAWRIVNTRNELKTICFDRNELEYQVVLFMQAVAIRQSPGHAPLLPEFQVAYGEDLRPLFNDLKAALAELPKLNVTPSLPLRGRGENYVTFDNGKAVFYLDPYGTNFSEQIVPAEFVKLLTKYALDYTNGQEFRPIEGVDHVVNGPVELWIGLRVVCP